MTPIFSPDISLTIEKELDDYFTTAISASHEIDTSYERLWTSLYKVMKSGGKRFRPNITMLAYEIFGGTRPADIIPIAAAQELLHFSLLIHDDIIDRDYIRHDVANVAGRYKTYYQNFLGNESDLTHFSHSAALLGGDLMLAAAHELIMKSTVDDDRKRTAHALLTKSIFDVAGGELLDTEASFLPSTAGHALKIALYKTARYSFVIPLVTGAKLAHITKEQEVLLIDYAETLGIAFQLVDDLLGVFGDEKQTGKSTLGDIREGKRTFMAEQAIKNMNSGDKLLFNQAYGNPQATLESINQAKDLIISSGGKQKTEEAISLYKNKALESISKLQLSPHMANKLVALADLTTKRNH